MQVVTTSFTSTANNNINSAIGGGLAEHTCLISNSLRCEHTLHISVLSGM
jgi:hypothetical protein